MERKSKAIAVTLTIGGITVLTLGGTVTDLCGFLPDEPAAEDGGEPEPGTTSSSSTTSTEATTTNTGEGTTSTTGDDDPEPGTDEGEDEGEDGGEGSPTPRAALGINLDYWQSFYPISALVTDARLLAQIYAPGVAVDADGYPSQDDHGQFRLILWNHPGAHHEGDYLVTWSGSGSVRTGRSCSNVGALEGGGFRLRTTGECHLDVTGRITDLGVVRTGIYVCDGDPTGEWTEPGTCDGGMPRRDLAEAYRRNPARWRWTPKMHRDLVRYEGMRTMMANRTNESPVADPAFYTRPTSLSYGATGAAYQHLFELAETVGHRWIWINIPWRVRAIEDWTRMVADAAKAAGYTGTVWGEYSNEDWNAAFDQFHAATAELAARYPDAPAPTGSNAGAVALDAASKLLPRDTMRMCRVLDEELGEQARCILAGHSGGLDPSGIDPYTQRPYDLETHSFGPGTYNARLLAELRSLDPEDRVDAFAVAPYFTGSTLASGLSAEAVFEHWSLRAVTGKWRATASANGIRRENELRASLGRKPLGLAWYEYGDHQEGDSATTATLASLTQGTDERTADIYADYVLHLHLARLGLPEAPSAAFAQTMTTRAPWGHWDPTRPCSEHAKCRAVDRVLGR